MALPFLDTNIFLRHLRDDHAEHSPRATACFGKIEEGELRVRTADTVVFEVVFTLQRYYKVPKAKIREVVLPLIELPGILLPGKNRLRKAFDLYVDLNISFADAYHAVLMGSLKLDEIITFDTEFDRVKGILRREP